MEWNGMRSPIEGVGVADWKERRRADRERSVRSERGTVDRLESDERPRGGLRLGLGGLSGCERYRLAPSRLQPAACVRIS